MLSDRQNGLIKAMAQTFTDATQYFRVQHLAANVDDKFDLAAIKLFTNLAYERSEPFWKMLDQLDTAEPALADYIRGFSVSSYARWACPNPPRFGQYATNISESTNASLLGTQEKPIQNNYWRTGSGCCSARTSDGIGSTGSIFDGRIGAECCSLIS